MRTLRRTLDRLRCTLWALALGGGLAGLEALPAAALGIEAEELPGHEFSFQGAFSTFDPAQLKRGFQVYKEVCAACHSMKYLSFRNLEAIGYSEDEVKAIAAEYSVMDGPDDTGEMYERPAWPSDRFPAPFPNEEAARYANNGALPPDLSLIVEAREGGADYVYAILTGYDEAMPADFHLSEGMNYNAYFPGRQIAMPPPLYDEAVEYEDGTQATVPQMAEDVATFLNWMAEPNLDERKKIGTKVLIFLGVFTALLYVVKRRVWAKLH